MPSGSSPRLLGPSAAAASSGSGEIPHGLLDPNASPAARSKAPSDPPSEFSSWHDDASWATQSIGDRTITVNMQRARMGEHLKGKLQGMIRQRFENYLRINQTLQNEIGKLASLECELRVPSGNGEDVQVRTNISCNEDDTFLVYLVPEVSTLQGCSSAQEFSGSEASCPTSRAVGAMTAVETEGQQAESVVPEIDEQRPPDGYELRRRWVTEVAEFGMSGRCHSLTALFHFGYTTWKQLGCGSTGNSVARGIWGAALRESARSPGHIAEEEERRSEAREDDQIDPLVTQAEDLLSVEELPAACPAEGRLQLNGLGDDPSSEAKPPESPRTLAQVLAAAQRAVERERHREAVKLCSEGLCTARSMMGVSSAASSSSAAPAALAIALAASAAATGDDLDAASAIQQLLLLRAGVQAHLRRFDLALADAEELIVVMPTCAEAYYWQSMALHKLGRGQEALEALMTAVEYEPQNQLYQSTFTTLFEEISAQSEGERQSRRSTVVVIGNEPVYSRRPPRRGQARDALSTTTQATHLSSRSTTPTEVSEPLSRSSSNDTLSVAGPPFEDVPSGGA